MWVASRSADATRDGAKPRPAEPPAHRTRRAFLGLHAVAPIAGVTAGTFDPLDLVTFGAAWALSILFTAQPPRKTT